MKKIAITILALLAISFISLPFLAIGNTPKEKSKSSSPLAAPTIKAAKITMFVGWDCSVNEPRYVYYEPNNGQVIQYSNGNIHFTQDDADIVISGGAPYVIETKRTQL